MRLLGLFVVLATVAACGESRVDQPVFNSGDQRVIDQLEKAGADLSRPRPVDFYLYFDHESDARSARAEVAAVAGRVSVDAPSAEVKEWLVLLTKRMVVNRSTIGELQARLETIAASHDGEYDGWEAPAEP